MLGDRGRYNFEGGHVYGEISVAESEVVTELAVGAYTQITNFTGNGWSRKITPDYTENHMTIHEPGIYEAFFAIHVENDEAQSQIIAVSMFAKNGTEEFTNVHSHTLLSGGLGDIEVMVGGGYVELLRDETIELWAISDSTPDLGVIFSDITFTLKKIS